MTTATVAAAEEEDGGRRSEGEATDRVEVVDAAEGADARVAAADGLSDGERLAREVVVIEDYTDFKRSMPLLPLRKPTPVQAVDLDQQTKL